jgi:putative tryptophan/tyrosine transport system substrate-binding protein
VRRSRREIITVFGCAVAGWSGAARSQQATKMPRIGLLSPFAESDTVTWHQAFVRGLQALGWTDGKTIAIEYRYAEGRNDRLPALIAELQRLKVDVIVTSVTNDTLEAKRAASDIPIVMAAAGDPVATGIVQSLARPGGNVTGLSQMNVDLSGKRLELLKTIAPRVSSVAVLLNPEDPISMLGRNEFQASAQKLGMNVRSWDVRNTNELDQSLRDAVGARVDALAIMPNPVFVINLKRIADFALAERLPSMFHLREFVAVGGLMSYGVDRNDLFRRAAGYVDKILKGARPADLPIEQPTKFELAVNLRTAKTLGLAMPASLLATADEVIE